MNPAVAQDDSELPYRNDELVVATPHVEQVKAALPGLGIKVQDNGQEDDPRLELSLLRLERSDGDDPHIDVDKVLAGLRAAFGKDNEGWSPTMGKNRFVDDQVIGGGSMSYGGFDDPARLSEDEQGRNERANWASTRPGGPGAGVVVGLVDTPISRRSTPLAGSWSGGAADMLADEGAVFEGDDPARRSAQRGHATFVAGLVLSRAPGARLVVRGTLQPEGRTDSWHAAKAIAELGQSVDILNLSFTCLTADGRPPLALATAISKVSPGTLIVAAAGNHGTVEKLTLPVVIDGHLFGEPCPHPDHEKDGREKLHDLTKCAAFPAALDSVVAVGAATDRKDDRTTYTPGGTWVDVLAAGQARSTFLTEGVFDGYAEWEGTSFAAAIVTGAVAAQTVPGAIAPKQALANLVGPGGGMAVVKVSGRPLVEPPRAWIA